MSIATQMEPERKLGRFLVTREANRLTLTMDNRGEVTLKAAGFIGFAILCVMTLAVVSVVAGSNASQALAPKVNLVGFLWAVATGAMFVVLPLYLMRVYKAPVTFDFIKSDATVRRDGSVVTRFERLEYLRITETRDNDGRYLYVLTLLYNDGLELPLHNGYDERAAQNIANEVAAFCSVEVRWV